MPEDLLGALEAPSVLPCLEEEAKVQAQTQGKLLSSDSRLWNILTSYK